MRTIAVATVALVVGVFFPKLAVANDAVVVAASAIKRTLPPNFHGINYVGFWDSAQGSAGSGAALAKTATRMIRFPGGDPGDYYDWQCPYWDGKTCPTTPNSSSWSLTSPLQLWTYAKGLGGTAMFQTDFQNNLPAPPGQTYAANSAQNAADWATYAKTQGMNVLFEIGNEEDIHMTSAHDANFQPYVDAFKAQAAAIHAAAPGTQVIGPAGTNEYFWWALDSLGMFLGQTGNKGGNGSVDGVSLHFYIGSDFASSVDRAQYWQQPGGPWEFIKGAIAANDTRALPVHITEWHVGSSTFAVDASMQNALVTADMIGAFAQSGVASHEYFATHSVSADPNSYGLLYGAGDARATDSPTPTYYALVLWGLMGDQVLGLTQSSDPKQAVSSYASRKADGSVQVMAINKSAAAQTVDVSFTGFDPNQKIVDAYTLSPTGDRGSKDARYNGALNPPPTALSAPTTSAASGATFSTSVAASSIVVLSFHGANATTGTGGGGSGGTIGGGTGGDTQGTGGAPTGTGGDNGTNTTGGRAATDAGGATSGGGGGAGGCGCRIAAPTGNDCVGCLGVVALLLRLRRRRPASRA